MGRSGPKSNDSKKKKGPSSLGKSKFAHWFNNLVFLHLSFCLSKNFLLIISYRLTLYANAQTHANLHKFEGIRHFYSSLMNESRLINWWGYFWYLT